MTPSFDPLGIYLSPSTARLNHSCVPNAVCVFSGPSLSIRSLEPIPKDEEIFICYTDNTISTPIRRAELQSRYFFSCTCQACLRGLTCFLPNTSSPQGASFDAIDAEAMGLMPEIKSSSPIDQARLLAKAMDLFVPYKSVYPVHRQPWASARHSFMLVSMDLQNWSLALHHAIKAYFYIDPVHCPQTWHPVRIVRKWVLLRLVTQIAYLHDIGEVKALEKYNIDWAVVAYGLLKEVRDGVGKSHGEENLLAKEVEGMYAQEIWKEVKNLKIAGMEVLEKEWSKLRVIADETD